MIWEKKDGMREYLKLLNNYIVHGSKNRLGAEIRDWAKKYNRDPKMVYRYQLKALKIRRGR